jgi:hypothetical protein
MSVGVTFGNIGDQIAVGANPAFETFSLVTMVRIAWQHRVA